MQQKAPEDSYLHNDTFLDIKRKNTFIFSLFPLFALSLQLESFNNHINRNED